MNGIVREALLSRTITGATVPEFRAVLQSLDCAIRSKKSAGFLVQVRWQNVTRPAFGES
ncbi:MAG: hypothetical protein ABIM50_12830 [Novosphingobium sp.]